MNRLFGLFREKILSHTPLDKPVCGEIEIDESCFGARRIRGKRGRGAAGKAPVLGVLKTEGQVYIQIVPNCSRESLLPIIQEAPFITTDGKLILNGYDHCRIYHSHNEFARGKNHVNGIESFWSFAKRRLAKFNGLTDRYFFFHLKESEFRFNHRHLYKLLLQDFATNPILIWSRPNRY